RLPVDFAAGINRSDHHQLIADQARILPGRNDGPDDFCQKHVTRALIDATYALTLVAFPIGSASSRLACGRGMTCTDTSSPTRRAAAAPASVAALTAATSPRTMAVTYPAPIFSQPTSVTFAALTIASAASIIATSPLVSIMP